MTVPVSVPKRSCAAAVAAIASAMSNAVMRGYIWISLRGKARVLKMKTGKMRTKGGLSYKRL